MAETLQSNGCWWVWSQECWQWACGCEDTHPHSSTSTLALPCVHLCQDWAQEYYLAHLFPPRWLRHTCCAFPHCPAVPATITLNPLCHNCLLLCLSPLVSCSFLNVALSTKWCRMNIQDLSEGTPLRSEEKRVTETLAHLAVQDRDAEVFPAQGLHIWVSRQRELECRLPRDFHHLGHSAGESWEHMLVLQGL